MSTRLRIPSSEEEAAEREAEGIDFLDKRRRKFNLGFFQLKTFFTGVVVAAMGCFFGCFGVNKDSSSNPNLQDSSPPTTPAVKVGAVKQNRSPLSSLFLSEANDDTPTKLKQDQHLGTPKPELGFNLKELNDQAKFLKACGTLSETPAEIRQATAKWQDLSAQEGDHEHPRFTSWLTNTSIEKLNVEIKSDQPPTPIKDCEHWVEVSGSLEHTPSSCVTMGQNNRRVSTSSIEGNKIKNDGSIEIITSPSNSLIGSSVTPSDIAPTIAGMKKSVRFDCDSDTSSAASKTHPFEMYSENSKQFGSATPSMGKSSPYPTPLKLSDDMQTPGTVFPAYLDAMGQGKNTRVRSQYVYSVLNPVENISQWKELKDEDPSFSPQNSLTREPSEQIDDKTPVAEMVIAKASLGQGTKVEASLSSWHGAQNPDPDYNAEHSGSAVGEKPHCGRTPGDRPILGMVAAHWNYDEPQVSPKWWDGNGIPNSTNKYKEDQKVSWHATPFEERLEKALSEDTLFPQRNQNSRTPPPDFNETEESDTGLSQLQPSSHFKSVASF